DLPHARELLDVVATAHSVTSHAVEHDLAGATLLDFLDPLQHVTAGFTRAIRVARELIRAVSLVGQPAVDTDHDALGAEARAQRVDERGIGEGGRVAGPLPRAGVEDLLRIGHRTDAAGDAEGDVQNASHSLDPLAVDRAAFRTRR